MNERELDDYLVGVVGLVEEYGWAVQGVFDADGGEPPFAYTVGLTVLGHPELIVIGLDLLIMQDLLNHAGAGVKGGGRYVAGERYSDLLMGGLTVGFRRCGTMELSVARRLYGDSINALQMLWPDPANRIPGDVGFDDRYAAAQPLLAAND